MTKRQSHVVLSVAFTAVFIGYFAVWLPGPAAGLQFIGLEIGEWIKFLGVGMERNWFYVPPITLGLMLAVWTWTWGNGRLQNWGMRGLAVAVSLLAFPAIEAIRFEAASEWRLRLQLIGLVVLVALLSGLVERATLPRWLPWLLLAALGLVGAIGPTRLYWLVRPAVSEAVGLPIGIGLGVWLNGVGHLGVTAVSLARMKGEG
jgi:hypothetical protein